MAELMNAVKSGDDVTVNGMIVLPVVEKCEGCDRVRDFDGGQYCSSYPQPERKWAGGRCNFATHVKVQTAAAAKVNPLKASKRAAKGR